MSFLTLEDINSTIRKDSTTVTYHEIDTSKISSTNDFANVFYDFVKISRTTMTGYIQYKFEINNEYWNGRFYLLKGNREYMNRNPPMDNKTIVLTTSEPSVILGLVLMPTHSFDYIRISTKVTSDNIIPITYNELGTSKTINLYDLSSQSTSTASLTLSSVGALSSQGILFYVYVVKSDFEFTCNQGLVLGKVNKVSLGTDSKYKPSGSMVGSYTPTIRVIYKGKTLPVSYDTNDYYFNLDLSDVTEPSKIKFTVEVDANDVLNSTSTEVKLQADYETINNLTGLNNLIKNGGVGRLGANITLTNPLTINRDVYIIGNDKTINLNSKQIIIGTSRTFKAEKTTFTNGVNSIHQNTGSTVELTTCSFSGCTGTGSVIECDIELHSLDNPTDFTTIIKGCTFTNNDLCLLHGGELTVENCTINGKISNPNYPYFLYQTDGTAILLRNNFNLSSDTPIETDIEFNSCIFICGETAQINGLSHTELKNNNVNTFIETPQNNRATVDVTYYYDVIEDNITLQSNKGYCHTVSGEDTIYKTNITATRS